MDGSTFQPHKPSLWGHAGFHRPRGYPERFSYRRLPEGCVMDSLTGSAHLFG